MMVKIGDRVTVDKQWQPSQVLTSGQNGSPGAYATFGLNPGDAGTAIAEMSPGTWAIIFDKAPTESVLVSDVFLVPVFELKEEPKPLAQLCSCTTQTIMTQGCVCGHWKRYVPPHKRSKE